MDSRPAGASKPATASSQPGEHRAHSVQRLSYEGTGAALFLLGLRHALLTVVTLGIYSFWARNNTRAFHYSHTELGGEPFAYHGTGGELLRGWLKAVGVILLIVVAVVVITVLLGGSLSPTVTTGGMLAIYAAIGVLALVAINGARRYRFSRSSWRGIRFSFHGSLGPFMGLMLKGTALSIVTLGFYGPFFANERRAFLVNNARYGSEPFVYEGEARPLFGAYVKALLLTIPTLGLYWFWYAAFQHRHVWSHTRIAGARFMSTVTGGGLLKLSVTNALLVLFTLGIGTPWAIVRARRFSADNLVMRGAPEWAAIQQRAETAGATAEAVAEALDVDAGIGL